MGKVDYDPNGWSIQVPEELVDADAGTISRSGETVGITYSDVRTYGYMFVGSEYLDEYENQDWFEAESIPAHYPGGGYFIPISRVIGENGFISLDLDDTVSINT
jgi:hypothetical protein